MPYIGNPPAERFTSFAYQDLTGGSGTSFTLDNAVGNPQEIEVFVNNVRQEPGVAYTVSGTALTMTGSIATTDDFYVVFQGKAIQTATHPSDRALTATDGTFTGDLTVDTNTLFVDSTNNHVAVGTTSPSTYTAFVSGSTSPGLVAAGTQAALILVDTDISGNDGTFGITKSGEETIINNLGNGSIKFFVNGSERAAFLADGGLTFNGDSGQVNALNDYEEGSFTPTVTDTSGNTGSASEATGYYRKIGGLVHVELRLTNINTSGLTSTDDVRVASLPFTHSSRTGTVQAIIGDIYHNHINLDYTGVLMGILGEGNDYFVIVETRDTSGDHDILVSDLTSGSADLLISFTYHTEQ